jgi:hypothetical protein
LLALSLALNAVPLWWGLPGHGGTTWAFDEIETTGPSTDARSRALGRYPPFHYMFRDVIRRSLNFFRWVSFPDISREALDGLIRGLVRALSVAMGTASVALVALLARRMWRDERAGLLAGALLAVSPTFAYYSKTANLDVPFNFWFLLALLFYARLLRGHAAADYVLFAVCATLSVGTKDPAVALFVLPSLSLLPLLSVERTGRVSLPGLARAAVDWRLVLATVAAVLAFAAVYRLDLADLREHVAAMRGHGAQPEKKYAASVVGYLAQAGDGVRQLAFILGWPGVALGAAGVVSAWRLRERRSQLLLLLFPISYYLFFLAVLRFNRDRYYLPIACVLAIFAGGAMVALLRARLRFRWLAPLAIVSILLVGLGRTVTLDLAMLYDSRYRVEQWTRERAAEGAEVGLFYHFLEMVPRLPHRTRWTRIAKVKGDGLERLGRDFIVYNATDPAGLGFEGLERALRDGWLGYVPERSFRGPVRFDRLIPSGLRTNLEKVNPRIEVLRRVGPVTLTRAEVQERMSELWQGGGTGWSELGRAVLEAPVLNDRVELGPRVVAAGLAGGRWTRSLAPALLVVHNESTIVFRPRLVLARGERAGATEVRIVGDGLQKTVRVEVDAPTRVPLPEVAPGEMLAVALAAKDDWVSDGERRLGVRVRVGF